MRSPNQLLFRRLEPNVSWCLASGDRFERIVDFQPQLLIMGNVLQVEHDLLELFCRKNVAFPIPNQVLNRKFQLDVYLLIRDDHLERNDQIPHLIRDIFLLGDCSEQIFGLEFNVPKLVDVHFRRLQGLDETIYLIGLCRIETIGRVDFEELVRKGIAQTCEGERDDFFYVDDFGQTTG